MAKNKNADTNGLINRINSCMLLANSMLKRKRYMIYVLMPNSKLANKYKGTLARLTLIIGSSY